MPIKPAFSAVELLLVAGISAILVAIAVPNFLEAKVRAEVVDVRATLINCQNALIQYGVSFNKIPEIHPNSPPPMSRLVRAGMLSLEPIDRFKEGLQDKGFGALYADPYIGFDNLETMLSRTVYAKVVRGMNGAFNNKTTAELAWVLKSIGPDQTDFQDEGLERGTNRPNPMGIVRYDPSNGVFSLGEILQAYPGK